MTAHRRSRTPISYAMLDFITGMAVLWVIGAIAAGRPAVLLGVFVVYAAILGLAKFFAVLPDGYFDHLLRRRRVS